MNDLESIQKTPESENNSEISNGADWSILENYEKEGPTTKHNQEFLDKMAEYRKEFAEGFRSDRRQELIERELNSKLTTTEELEEQVALGNPEVGKRTIDYEGKGVVVYDLKGYPFGILSSAVDFRANADGQMFRHNMAQAVLEDPAVWAIPREEAQEHFTTRGKDMQGDTFSGSYISSAGNLRSRISTTKDDYRDKEYVHLCYGFGPLEANSLMQVSDRDAGTINNLGSSRHIVDKPNPYILEGIEHKDPRTRANYSDFTIKRYLENGGARLPQEIVAEDDKITENMLRHAAYFEVPIFNVMLDNYDEKIANTVVDNLERVKADSDYREIYRALRKASAAEKIGFHWSSSIFLGNKSSHSARYEKYAQDPIKSRLAELAKAENIKITQKLKEILHSNTERCREATATGKWFEFYSDLVGEISFIKVNDQRDGKETEWYSDPDDGEELAQKTAACNEDGVEIDFKMYDGEERMLDFGDEQPVEGLDYGSFRDTVLEYLGALKENHHL